MLIINEKHLWTTTTPQKIEVLPNKVLKPHYQIELQTSVMYCLVLHFCPKGFLRMANFFTILREGNEHKHLNSPIVIGIPYL